MAISQRFAMGHCTIGMVAWENGVSTQWGCTRGRGAGCCCTGAVGAGCCSHSVVGEHLHDGLGPREHIVRHERGQAPQHVRRLPIIAVDGQNGEQPVGFSEPGYGGNQRIREKPVGSSLLLDQADILGIKELRELGLLLLERIHFPAVGDERIVGSARRLRRRAETRKK